MILACELHPGSFVRSETGSGIGIWTAGCYAAIEKEFTEKGWVYKVEPEDITPAILEKLGFVRIPEFSETHWEYELITRRHKIGYHCGTSSLTIDGSYRITVIYLHQFQNLWICLEGEELRYNP